MRSRIDTSRLNWEVPEYVLLSLALGLVVGLIFGWMYGALGGPSTGYTAIEDGERHMIAKYHINNETQIDILHGKTGWTSCLKTKSWSNDSMDYTVEAYECHNYPNQTHSLMRESN